MALNAQDLQIAGDGAATAILDHVAEPLGGGGLSHQAPGDLLLTRLERFDHLGGAIDKGALFIAGDEKGDGALMIRMGGDEALHGDQHGGQGALHVGGAPTVEQTIAHRRLEGRRIPLLEWSGGHHIGVTGKAEQRPLAAAASPEVGGVMKHHGLDDKTQARQILGHHLLASGILRSD